MIFVFFLLVLPAQIACIQHSFRRSCLSSRHSILSMRLSPADEVMRDLKQLSIAEVRSLSKEYGLDETLVKATQIKNLESAIQAINVAEQANLPSPAQTLKVSPLEKTVTVEGTADSKSKYGLENNLDIGNVLKQQGVRIDDLMALRDSLMKGGFKFNDDDDDEDMSGSIDDIELSDDVIAKEFYGDGNEFGEYEEDSSDSFTSNKGNIGSSKNAFDAIAAEAEKSASNTLKSKAIKEAKLLAKLEGKEVKKTSVKKREIKTKPQNAESGYEKKVRTSDREFNAMRQSESREYKEEKSERDDIVVKKSEKIVLSTSEIEEEDSLIEELMAKNVLSPKSLEIEKNVPAQKKEIAVVEPTPVVKKEVEKVVYVKLKRRIEDEDEDEDEKESSENEDSRSYDFSNLEDLDDRMDELYGDLESNSVKTETDMIITDLAPKSLKGSNSKDPIKWKNGRLVNEKDKFFDKIRTQTIGNDDENSEEEEDEDEDRSEGDATERKTTIKKSSSKKVVVELTGVTMKNMLEHLETTIGFDGLFSETNLRCFSVKPSINSALKVLRQLPLEWARKKIEYLYIQSKKQQ